jgi:threonine/homoserine/homoserine lactone efflux protein
MPSTATLVLFAIATFLLTVSPGPGVLYVVARTLAQGRAAGFASMLGIESGELLWLAATATGLAALLETSSAALTILRWAGAAYLVYLGIQRWRHSAAAPSPERAPVVRIYAQGVVTQILNPKVAVFFVAFLPQFLDPARPFLPQVAALGAIYIAIAVMVDVSYVFAASGARRLMRSDVARRRTARASAATYITLGIGAAASSVK